MKTPSAAIKIAALILLVSGLLMLISGTINLVVEMGKPVNPEELLSGIEETLYTISIIEGVLSTIIGYYLIKLKRWSFITGLIFTIIPLVLFAMLLANYGKQILSQEFLISLILTLTTLGLLIAGRRDFSKKS
ncbi:MAG: hypothetical protein AAB373_01480 [Patescibacteria group bacterium]